MYIFSPCPKVFAFYLLIGDMCSALLPPPQIPSVSAGCADLPLTTTAARQTLVNAQSARAVNNIRSAATVRQAYTQQMAA